jgi:hypothetical protein
MVPSTVAMTNPFFASLGLLQRLAVGTYIPSKEVLAYFNKNDSATAGRHLDPRLARPVEEWSECTTNAALMKMVLRREKLTTSSFQTDPGNRQGESQNADLPW